MAKPPRPDLPSACLVRAELLGIEPPIWRELLLDGDFTLFGLHRLLQAAFGWDDDHMHEFLVGRTTYMLDPGNASEDECEITLAEALPRKGSKLLYRYDFGDGWEIKVTLNERRTLSWTDGPPGLGKLLAGARAAPPEDCGGVGRYLALCEASLDPAYPRREELLEWCGGEPIDPEAFELDVVAAAVAEVAEDLVSEGAESPDGPIELVDDPYGDAPGDGDDDDGDGEGADEDDPDEDGPDEASAEEADGDAPLSPRAAREVLEHCPYDADTDAHLATWMDFEESDRLLAVEAYHVLQPKLPRGRLRLHAHMQESVEVQLAQNDPKLARTTLGRLRAHGVGRHKAVHALIAALGVAMRVALNDPGSLPGKVYESALRELDPADWRG